MLKKIIVFSRVSQSQYVVFKLWNINPVKNKIRKFSTNVTVDSPTKIRYAYESKQQKRKYKVGKGKFPLLAIPVITFGLGTWQIQRKIEKNKLLNKLKELTNLEPVSLPYDLEEIKSMEYRSVKVAGEFDHNREILMGPCSKIDNNNISQASSLISVNKAGYCVITPFKLSDRDLTILVNRGWVPSSHKSAKHRLAGQVKGETEIVGLIRCQETRQPFGKKNIPEKGLWMYRDINKISEILGTSPIWIDSSLTSSTFGEPYGRQTVISIPDNHLSYIFTWYGLSAATSYLWYLKYISKHFK